MTPSRHRDSVHGATHAVRDQRRTEPTAENTLAQRDVRRVETAHEAHRHQVDRILQSRLCSHYLTALICRWGQGLLAHHRLTGAQGCKHQIGMCVVAGRDHDGVHFGVVDQLGTITVDAGAEFVCDGSRDTGVEIGHGDQVGTGHHASELAGVVGPHHADSDDSNTHCHRMSITY